MKSANHENEGIKVNQPPKSYIKTPVKKWVKKLFAILLCILGGVVLLPILFIILVSILSNSNEGGQSSNAVEWTEKHYVDEFGASTNNKYMQTELNGTFSNSATTNSPLKVVLTVDMDSTIKIALYEYGDLMVKDQIHTMKVRHNNDTTYSEDYFSINKSGWGYLAYLKNEKHLCDQLPYIYEGGKMEFVITERREYGGVPSTYKFKIDNASVLDEAFEKMKQ